MSARARAFPSLDEQIARCDREIQAMESHEEHGPAYLRVMGLNDWHHEKRLLAV